MSIAAFFTIALLATSPEARDIDAFVRKAMDQVEVAPGLSVTVVKGPDVVMTAGYGVADLSTGKAVDADTGFYIASATKAFAPLSIAAMSERRELALHAPLKTWIGKSPLPADIASSTSLNDLLSHRSGLENEPIASRRLGSWSATGRPTFGGNGATRRLPSHAADREQV